MALIVGIRHRIDDVDEFLTTLASISKKYKIEVQALDAAMVFGMEHAAVAVDKAERAFSDGRNISNNITTETLLYAGCERQISTAIEKMGVKASTDKFVLVLFGAIPIEEVLKAYGWEEDRSAFEPHPNNLKSFGIEPMEGIKITDLIIEKMALAELER